MYINHSFFRIRIMNISEFCILILLSSEYTDRDLHTCGVSFMYKYLNILPSVLAHIHAHILAHILVHILAVIK